MPDEMTEAIAEAVADNRLLPGPISKRHMGTKAARRATRGAFKPLRNPVIQPDFSTMDPKFMTRAQRILFREREELAATKRAYEL